MVGKDRRSDRPEPTGRDRERGPDRATPRTGAEEEALAAASYHSRVNGLSTPPERAYAEALGPARRDILHRFVCGLFRDDPAGLPEHHVTAPASPSVPDSPELLAGLEADRLVDSLRPLPGDCRHLGVLPLPASGVVVVVPIERVHGYDRIRPVDDVRRWTPDGVGTVEHPVDLVPLLEREGAFVDADQAERFRLELAESVANLALAGLAERTLRTGRGSSDSHDSRGSRGSRDPGDSPDSRDSRGSCDPCDPGAGSCDPRDPGAGSVLDAVVEAVPAAAPAAAFERTVTGGHPFHPGAKIRRGMSPAGGLVYAPEFTDRIDLRFVAVRRDCARETRASGAGRFTDRLLTTFGGLDAALVDALPRDRDPAEYAVVPVHPWQYHHTVPDRYDRPIADGRVVPVPSYTHPATPQLNLRTVVPYATDRTAGEPLPHLKLAIGVRTTNVVRTLSPHAVTNGPRVTDLLGAIDDAEALDSLGFLSEPSATCYDPPGGPHVEGPAFDDARHLSGLLRAPPADHRLVPDGARPVVASGLLAGTPATGRPLVRELVDRYAGTLDTTDPTAAALRFVDRYAGVVVPEQLLLMTKYGVALESHLQNSLVVFEGPRPVAALVRDFGGIRVDSDRLDGHGLSIDPYPDSDLDADGATDLHGKLYYALFQNHLGELVATLAHELDVDERDCWDRVRRRCTEAFERMASDPTIPEDRIERDRRALFEDPVTHKALTAMRLQGKRHEYATSRVSNPLARDR